MPTLLIRCQDCDQKLSVSTENAGLLAQCPICQAKTRIPENGETVEEAEPTEDEQPQTLEPAPSAPNEPPEKTVSPGIDDAMEGTGAPTASPSGSNESTAEPKSEQAAANPEGLPESQLEPQPEPEPDPEPEPEPYVEPDPTEEELRKEWLVSTDDNQQFGPVDLMTLDEWVAEGRLSPTTTLRREADDEWRPAKELYPILKTTLRAPLQNNARETVPVLPHRGGFLLTLGIIGLLTLIPVISIAVMIMASNDMAEMRRKRLDPSGLNQTQGAFYLGAIGLFAQVTAAIIAIYVVLAIRGLSTF